MNVFMNAVLHLLQIQIEVITLNTFTVYPFYFFLLKKPFLSDPFKQICKCINALYFLCHDDLNFNYALNNDCYKVNFVWLKRY